MHSILIIGCGSIGERHLRCFLDTKRARVTACDDNPVLLRSLSERYGVPVVENWRDAIASGRFGAVVICTPAQLHVPMAIAALMKGLAVLIEKPLSISLKGVDTLVEVKDRTGNAAAVAYVYHNFPVLEAAKTYLLSGEIGRVRHVVCCSGQHFPKLRPANARPYAETYYRDRQTGGGAIQDALTHTANWIEGVIGPTESVLCDCSHQVLPGVTVEDTVNISARNGDILVNYSLNQFQRPNENLMEFHATDGSVRIELHRNRWGVFRPDSIDWEWHQEALVERDSHFTKQAQRFMDLIEGRPAPLCSLSAAVQSLRFNLSALASADAGGVRVRCASLHA